MSTIPTGSGLSAEGRAIDLSADPRVGALTRMLRDVSAIKDPAQMLKHFGPWVGQRFPREAFISVSIRDLPPGKYKITRAITNTNSRNPLTLDKNKLDRDPWREWVRLPTYTGGLIGKIIAQDQPQIITHVDFSQDPVLGEVLGEDARRVRALSAIPTYDDAQALNWAISFHQRLDWTNLDTFVEGLLDVNLMGTATRNLVFRRQAESLNEQLVGQFEQIAKIQRQLLPERSPRFDSFKLATSYLTSNIAGGDYYDFYRAPNDDRVGFVIADVSGHGPGAATVMAMIRSILHCYPDVAGPERALDDVAGIARYCNEKLVAANLNGEFATAFFCVLDPRDGTLSWNRCGHNPPLLRRADGTIETIESAATIPLGISNDMPFESDSCVMHPGDTLILYTDGITEATRNRPAHEASMHPAPRDAKAEMFGMDRLIKAVGSCSGEPGCAIDSIHGALFKFSNRLNRDDDQTLVVLQRNPE
ncbi:MAG: PP2C family protein-serine/threonine phosphatase [Phycisphaerales bacterium JB052]